MNYQFYVQDTLNLLNDQASLFTPQAQLTRWINTARRDCAKLTGCIQRFLAGQSALGASAQPGFLIPGGVQPGALPGAFPATQNPLASLSSSLNSLQTIVGVERYPYKGFFNPYLTAQYDGLEGVIDVIALSNAWQGAYRPALNWYPWDDFQAYCRAFANQTTSFPVIWTVFNDGEDGEVWLFPSPSQANEIEATVACVPAPIYSDNDFDAIPEGFRDSIKFKAAALAFLAGNRYAQAQAMEAMFMNSIGIDAVARDRGKTPSMYNTVF